MFDAADREWECAAAMRESDPEFWKTLKDAAENHRTDGERCFGRHADEPWQPVFRHALFAEHIPRMNEDRGAELFRRAPDRLKRSIVEIQSVDAAEVWVRVYVGADLSTSQPQLGNTTLQLARRHLRVL